MRKIVALLLLFCLVVSPVLAMKATDVEGTTDDKSTHDYYEKIVEYAAAQQSGKGYIAKPHLQPEIKTVFKGLKEDNIYFFNGHCSPGGMGIKSDEQHATIPVVIYAENHPGEQLKGLGLPNMQFAFFDCCRSAIQHYKDGNLVGTAYHEGAKCVFGFGIEIEGLDPAAIYGQAFWDAANGGATWFNAHLNALGKLKKDPRTAEHCKSNNSFCGYGSLEQVGGDACRSYMQPNPAAIKTITQPMETTSQPSGLETATITLDQAQDIIREFTGNPNLKVKYEKSDDELSSNLYSFTDDDEGEYVVNSVTHRVEYAGHYSLDLLTVKPGKKEVSLDAAYVIAENFAKKQYPQLWDVTDKAGIRVERKEKRMQDLEGTSYTYNIGWSDEYYYPDRNTPGHITIRGLKNIYVSVAPNGEIYTYDEDLKPRDEPVLLNPDITEDQAWEIAKEYILSEDNAQMTDNDKTSFGLGLRSYNNKQSLVWDFKAVHRDDNEFSQGGRIEIDAHDGHIVLYSPYM